MPPSTAASFLRTRPETRRNSSVHVLCWPGENGHFGIAVTSSVRANYANYSIGCIPTYLIYSSVKPFLITALNCLNTEGKVHSEKYTVRGSIAHAARVVTSIYIVANGNDHAMRNFKHSQ